jgi:exodeoxyribonuclease VII large subunit
LFPEKEAISLYELNRSIQLELKTCFSSAYWIIGEINELKVNYSGHCYIELIEKDKNTEAIIAKSRATIWAGTYRKLLPYFETTAGHAFTQGIKVMVRASVEFHELYGLSLNIVDIDPAYTIGDLEQQKKDAIEKLKTEGVFMMNKELQLPLVAQKIAVISSLKAAGYGDFTNQLENNPHGYKFYHKLFPAVMQGENAELSVIAALEKIYSYENFFDAVVIIRGGGSKTDLSCFDKYWLAYHITQFPLPVLTGIGHEQDDTVTDMVAHTRLKTPTAAASFLIEKAALFEEGLDDLYMQIKERTDDIVSENLQNLIRLTSNFERSAQQLITGRKENLSRLAHAITNNSFRYIERKSKHHIKSLSSLHYLVKSQLGLKKHLLEAYKGNLKTKLHYFIEGKSRGIHQSEHLALAYNPQNVLDRGYSITLINGKTVKQSSDVEIGDVIETRLKSGSVKSKITIKKE